MMTDYRALAEKLIELQMLFHLTPITRELSKLENGMFLALSCLANNQQEVHPKELSQKMAVSSARIAALLNHMEKEGLILRKADPKDNRQIVILLTDRGKQLIKQKREEVVNIMTDTLEELGPEEAEAYLRIQMKIIRSFMHRT